MAVVRHPTTTLKAMLSRAGVPALVILITGFFGYYAVLGPNGVLAYREYTRQLERRQVEFARVDKARAELRNRVRLLDPKGADPDLIDELTRRQLNVAHPNEVIISLR
jgi:cell division protein FtsB